MGSNLNGTPTVMRFKPTLLAFASGALFALGLVVSGMTQPLKVLGFLNLGGVFSPARFGPWDPSLALVMGGAVAVSLLAYFVTASSPEHPSRKPWFALKFELPARKDIDGRLIVGAALFGIGWGLAGYCPGPALASLLTGGLEVVVFVFAMIKGMMLAQWVLSRG